MQYLSPDDLGSAYTDATSTARKSWLKYDEIERLMNNEVRTDLPANMPKVNDGSLSASIKKIEKRLFAKPMTGTITAVDRDEDWIAELVNIILTKRIIPNATTDASFLRKWKMAVRNAKAYGGQPIYTFFTQHGNYTGADMSLPYVRNVYLEPGKVSDLASDFIFMDSWYTKLQAKRLLDKAREDEQAVLSGELDEKDCIWDAKALQAWYDAGPSGKESWNQTQSERAGQNRNEKGLYKLSTCFNRGYEAPFYTFAPNTANKVVGTDCNTNPTGDLPITYVYHDEDLINPYGKGLVEAAGPNQNVLDNLTQTDVLQTQIAGQPSFMIGGDRSTTNLKSFVHAPGQFWFRGNAEVEVVNSVDPQMYNALPTRFGMYKAQQQFITGTFDNSVSADSGQPGFSKTDAGVKSLSNQTNADDNDTLQSVSDAYTRVIKNLVNIHMNNMEGRELLSLEGDEIDRMAKTDLGIPIDPTTGQPATGQIELVWDNLRGNFDFSVDPTSSMLEEAQTDSAAIQQVINDFIQNPMAAQLVQQSGYKFNLGDLYAELLEESGIKNIDKILVKITPQEQAEIEQQQQAQAVGGQVDPATGQPIDPSMQDPNAQPDPTQQQPMPEQAPMEQEQPQEDMQPQMGQHNLDDIMEQWNVDQDTAATIASALDHGVPEDRIPGLLEMMAQGATQ